MSLAQIAVTLFLIMDPLGNIPIFLSLLKDFEPKKQRKIIFRELIIALAVIIFFNFLGNEILGLLHITQATVQIAGGIILFLISLQMIFPKHQHPHAINPKEEPFIVPLAIPLVAGPSILGTVMIYAHQEENNIKMMLAIFIAWTASTILLLLSSWLKKILGTRVLIAAERLMGLIMTILAVDLFNNGIITFLAQ